MQSLSQVQLGLDLLVAAQAAIREARRAVALAAPVEGRETLYLRVRLGKIARGGVVPGKEHGQRKDHDRPEVEGSSRILDHQGPPWGSWRVQRSPKFTAMRMWKATTSSMTIASQRWKKRQVPMSERSSA